MYLAKKRTLVLGGVDACDRNVTRELPLTTVDIFVRETAFGRQSLKI